jgi:hypothetical protein
MTMSNDLDPRFTPAQQRAMRGERFPCDCGYDGPGWEGRTRCAHCGGERDDITWRLKSSELRRGDIVHCHGMNVLLDGTPTQYSGAQGLPAYRYRGLVLNRAEVSEEDVPRAYTPDDRWTIQGNDVARWIVTRKRTPTSDDVKITLSSDPHAELRVDERYEYAIHGMLKAMHWAREFSGMPGITRESLELAAHYADDLADELRRQAGRTRAAAKRNGEVAETA